METNTFNDGHIQIKSNSSEGDAFISGIYDIRTRWAKSRDLFMDFCRLNGYSQWHIHDGWVMHGYTNGDVLSNSEIRVVWISDHQGYSFSRAPKEGELFLIIEGSPDIDFKEPFKIYIHKVNKIERSWTGSRETQSTLIEVKQVVFSSMENKYVFYKKSSLIWWEKMKNALTRK